MDYRYDHFSRRLLIEDMAFHAGPQPGEAMPDFELVTSEGERVRKQDLLGGKPMLLTMGSFT